MKPTAPTHSNDLKKHIYAGSLPSNSKKIDPRQSISRHMSKRAKYSGGNDPAVKDLRNTLRKISGGY